MDLSEKEKKLLYQPGGKFGRKLSHSDVISDGDSVSIDENNQLSGHRMGAIELIDQDTNQNNNSVENEL